jgi:riboflavin synthase
VTKGFIAIDGTSLTVCEVNQVEKWFTFMLVQFTQHHVIIPHKEIGDEVNLEVDAMGKYVEKSLAAVMSKINEMDEKLKNVLERLDALDGQNSSSSKRTKNE